VFFLQSSLDDLGECLNLLLTPEIKILAKERTARSEEHVRSHIGDAAFFVNGKIIPAFVT
jgi:hypothetical protein